MKRGVRNKTTGKRLKMVIFKLLVLSYMHTTFFFFKTMNKFYVVWKYKKKLNSTNMELTHS